MDTAQVEQFRTWLARRRHLDGPVGEAARWARAYGTRQLLDAMYDERHQPEVARLSKQAQAAFGREAGGG
jgi:hypothetical protein